MKLYSHLFVLLSVLMCYSQAQEKNDSLARIGSHLIDQSQFNAFQKAIRVYPSQMNNYFPARRSPVTFLIESEILFSKASPELVNKLEKSPDWQWKKMYYPAQFYLMDILAPNLGLTEEQLKSYYDSHKKSYKVSVKVDSSKKDSTFYKEFSVVKNEIVNALFLKDNKPDQAFIKSLGDSLPSSETINQEWISNVRSNAPQYFMKKFYKEDFGKPYPDSISEIYGKGKIITDEDMSIILSWIPEERRDYYTNAEGKKELAEWLLKWKLFSSRAQKTGFAKLPQVQKAQDYAWKIEVATAYVKQVLPSLVNSSQPLDTTIIKYLSANESSSSKTNVDSTVLKNKIQSIKDQIAIQSLDSLIYSFRKNAAITLYNNELRDEKNQNPAELIVKADSLRDSAKTDEAEQIYNSLSNNFTFSPEGKRATIELAKILTERQSYYQAIDNYRKYLLIGDDKSKLCNVFFMIGFIYDEYLDKPELAEINYKYVLKNLSNCELTDDAEFMMLHLGEPMSSVEELQAEALRQGRKIDMSDNSSL